MSNAPLRDGVLLLAALCPALAVSDTVVNAFGLGASVLVCAPVTALAFLALRRWLTPHTFLAGALLTAAGVVGCAELLVLAYFPAVHARIDLFLALFAVNLVIAGALIRSDPVAATLRNVLLASATIASVLLVLGAGRELVGRGSLLHGAAAAFGDWARGLETSVFSVDMGFLLGMLPTGAFIALGLLIAALNWIELRRTRTARR